MNVETIDRLELIRKQLDRDGRVRVSDLATELDVSEMTVRRDLDMLVDEGVAQRVRGGALAARPQSFADRFQRNSRAKARVADKLLDLVGEGGAIGIDASSTLQRLAVRLGAQRDLTVLTNSPDTFAVLQDHAGVTALLTGGELDKRTGSLVGPMASRAARDLSLRRLFVSAAAVDATLGTTEMSLEEADVKLALGEVAAEIIVAIDSSKLGHRAAARTFMLDRVDILVTDLDPGHTRLDAYRDHVRLI
jgi:DeoR family fructose operon transcriptional repressor